MAEVLNYSADLNSMTSGKGIFTMEFGHYDGVPEHLKANIIEGNQKESGKGRQGYWLIFLYVKMRII